MQRRPEYFNAGADPLAAVDHVRHRVRTAESANSEGCDGPQIPKQLAGQHSSRNIHPLGLFYWGKVWTLVAWCELRDAFRHFRLDRIQRLSVLPQHFESRPGQTLQDFLSTECKDD